MEGDALARLQDRREIEDALVCYARALDDRDWGRLVDCFVPEARVRYGERPELVGLEAVTNYVRRALAPLDASQHRIGTLEVVFTGPGEARSRCYLAAEHIRVSASGGSRYTVGGSYADRWRRTESGWRISERTLLVSWTDGNPRVLGGDAR